MSNKQAELIDLALGSTSTTYPAPDASGIVDKTNPDYVPKKRRVLPKIILDEPSHDLHQMVVGNESHFWTEVDCADGKTYCFDNNHPGGVEKADFYASLDFLLERERPEDGGRDVSKVTVFGDESHQFMTREDILAKGQVVIAPLSVEQQRRLADNITDWKRFPDKLKGAESVSEESLRPAQPSDSLASDVSVTDAEAETEMSSAATVDNTEDEAEVRTPTPV